VREPACKNEESGRKNVEITAGVSDSGEQGKGRRGIPHAGEKAKAKARKIKSKIGERSKNTWKDAERERGATGVGYGGWGPTRPLQEGCGGLNRDECKPGNRNTKEKNLKSNRRQNKES